MTKREALRKVWDLAAGNSLTEREAGNNPDLLAQKKEQDEALDMVWTMLLETPPEGAP